MTATVLPPENLAPVPPGPVEAGARRGRLYGGVAMIVVALYGLWAFGLGSRTDGTDTTFALNLSNATGLTVPDLTFPSAPVAIVLCVLAALCGVVRITVTLPKRGNGVLLGVFLFLYVVAFLAWAAAAKSINIASVLEATILAAVPLILGALAGVLGERSGVINVAIEGQFLLGACLAAFTASVTGSLLWGLVAGVLVGGLFGLLLAVFAQRYLVEQVVLGVVLTMLATGLTGFFYERVMQSDSAKFNMPMAFAPIKIPLLAELPVIGPVFFHQNILVYAAAALIAIVHVVLFHTRWGLRTRAVGEHPTAADTVGVNVIRTRYLNMFVGGMIAGLGGVWLTIGLNISFNKNMAAGAGFIALAAVIFGRWSPIGALWAALLFGFAGGLSNAVQLMQTPVPTDFLRMLPYLATIFAVAGLLGHVRAPAADGQPYTKS
ncbi:ABC transporter permease [Actinocorallia sp. A-T 12471]|uniref:ABC transporter permease n=1 Tax=Actinocorallia sp. A-T 12471 TaxID=3089813 RepID=UPI0029D19080|nr:ABC transporter permease [Actinocorallia sp. A-T 12471]MDX6744514.1 ABC transporter permease [Actinocorallia sp. A-T 12471]